MVPRLFEHSATAFTSQGLGNLSEATVCHVEEGKNDAFTLQMQYPITGLRYGDIALRSIILAKPSPLQSPQPFRVKNISAPSDGMVTIDAEHISYDLSGVVAEPFEAGSAAEAMEKLTENTAPENPFTLTTDLTTVAQMHNIVPQSVRSLMGGVEGSVIDVYGGEWEYDKWTCYLRAHRGQNNGVTIRYGKNLQTLTQEQNCANVYTAVYPYWKHNDTLVTLQAKTVACPGTYDFVKVLPLDLSDKFSSAPTEGQLRAACNAYITANNIGKPTVSLSVSFIQLEQTAEYKTMALLERVELGDTVKVEFPAMRISATARVVKTVYDVLNERYITVEIGSYRGNIASTIATIQQTVARQNTQISSPIQAAIERATELITGNLGGYVVHHDADGDGYPDEILVMDADDISTAVNVWRWNKNGLGHSSSGYNGPYSLALTAEGQLVADFIKTGTLDAALANIIHLNASNITSGTINGYAVNVSGALQFTGQNSQIIAVMNEIINMIEDDGETYHQYWHLNKQGLRLNEDDVTISGTAAAMAKSLRNLENAVFFTLATNASRSFAASEVPSAYLILDMSSNQAASGVWLYTVSRSLSSGIDNGVITLKSSSETNVTTTSSGFYVENNDETYTAHYLVLRLY